MKRINVLLMLLVLIAAFNFSACKKNQNPSVGFSTTQVSLNAQTSPNATVTVQLSKAVNENVEIWLQMMGPDTLQFGSLNTLFLNDDSNRITGSISSQVIIDTPIAKYMAHLVVGYANTGFTISLAALFDNFAKRGVQYKIKIVQVGNATIQSGNDVLTINIAQQPMVPEFTSTMYIVDPNYGTSEYVLGSFTYAQNAQGTYNFGLSYNELQGSSPTNSFGLSFSNMVPDTGIKNYPSDDGLGTLTTNFQLSPVPSSTRGNFYVMDTLGKIIWVKNGDTATATVKCSFVKF